MVLPSYKQDQNKPELIRLLKASFAAYKKAKAREFTITWFLIALAIAYPICYIMIDDPAVEQGLFGVSFLLTIITWSLADYFKGNTEKGALLKEEFDVALFSFPWKFTLPRADLAEVIQLEKEYKGPDIVNWYPDNISAEIPPNNIIAVCQRISSSWDIDIRSKYKTALTILLFIYSVLIFLFWVLASVNGHKIFLIYFSTLAFYEHFISLIRGNTHAIRKRKELIRKLDEYINHKKVLTSENLRDIQDDIYYIRQEPSKVPDFFYSWYNQRISETLVRYVNEINKLYIKPL